MTTNRPVPFSARMKGQNAFMNSSVGLTTHRAVISGRSRATVLGASSPSTMCSAVITANAQATAMVCAVVAAIGAGRNASAGSNSDASAGSPIQPRPMLAMVMPSCVAAM